MLISERGTPIFIKVLYQNVYGNSGKHENLYQIYHSELKIKVSF